MREGFYVAQTQHAMLPSTEEDFAALRAEHHRRAVRFFGHESFRVRSEGVRPRVGKRRTEFMLSTVFETVTDATAADGMDELHRGGTGDVIDVKEVPRPSDGLD